MKEDPRRQDWRQLDLVLAYLIHPSVHPADVDSYCGPDAGAGINSTGVLPLEWGLRREMRMYFEGCSRLPPDVIFTGSLRVRPSWLLRSGSCKSPEHRAKCHCCWSHARYLSQGNFKQGSNSKPLLTTCLELLMATPMSDSLVAYFWSHSNASESIWCFSVTALT